MTRTIALIAMFFLLFANTGVHKTYAASPNGQSDVSAAFELAKTTVIAKAKCCIKLNSIGAALHGSCSTPCATLSVTDFTILVPKSEKPSPMKGALFEGSIAKLQKRPPKYIF